ncbi:hypothetical protein [Chondromyces apiculatus]|uniref:Dehydrogenase n=1 Tax=Chondromyces apiculatus DSM 436 TaxID=1192034 RepID=A0A017ST17_9BACT|nr:hypothetical protein [Chondromyces apiculatus]EYF00128.1 Dehydrogenase [Chondromyces apiculatus DSM 436]
MAGEDDEVQALVETYRKVLVGAHKSWALFAQGTCVILMDPKGDLAEQAKRILAEWGPVQAGTPSGDFEVVELEGGMGWVVTGHHPDVLNFVGADEVEAEEGEFLIGVVGRGCRETDAVSLRVVHVEDKRSA